MPVGIAITEVAAAKYARVSTSSPTVYIWWPQTIKPKNAIDIIAQTMPWYPKIGLEANRGIT